MGGLFRRLGTGPRQARLNGALSQRLDDGGPFGRSVPTARTVLGALLAFGAVWIASRRPRDTTAK
ncbi:hypothetical protein SZMC14600_14780 [Saccharomonospora azurea SZMC 14600]|nr:hypothetical protein SZMC14600_14780 [Saccharomonospora azurea SZMC 14600]